MLSSPSYRHIITRPPMFSVVIVWPNQVRARGCRKPTIARNVFTDARRTKRFTSEVGIEQNRSGFSQGIARLDSAKGTPWGQRPHRVDHQTPASPCLPRVLPVRRPPVRSRRDQIIRGGVICFLLWGKVFKGDEQLYIQIGMHLTCTEMRASAASAASARTAHLEAVRG